MVCKNKQDVIIYVNNKTEKKIVRIKNSGFEKIKREKPIKSSTKSHNIYKTIIVINFFTVYNLIYKSITLKKAANI